MFSISRSEFDAWLIRQGLPARDLSGPMTPAKLLASPDSLTPSQREALQVMRLPCKVCGGSGTHSSSLGAHEYEST